jgi:hypothetical protein
MRKVKGMEITIVLGLPEVGLLVSGASARVAWRRTAPAPASSRRAAIKLDRDKAKRPTSAAMTGSPTAPPPFREPS